MPWILPCPIFCAHASGCAHVSASFSRGTAPCSMSNRTSLIRPRRHAQPRGVLFRMPSRPSERAPASKAARPKAITSPSVIRSRIAAISWRIVQPNDPTMLASQAASTSRKHSRNPFDPALCCPPAATECGAKSPKALQACGTNAHRRGASRRAPTPSGRSQRVRRRR
jgi:hypothetical protein